MWKRRNQCEMGASIGSWRGHLLSTSDAWDGLAISNIDPWTHSMKETELLELIPTSLRLEFSWVVMGYFRHYRGVEVEFSLNFKVLHFSVCWIFFLLHWIMKYKFTVCWWCIHKDQLFYFSFLFLFHILALLHLFIYFIFHCLLLAGTSNNNRGCIIV